jgi:plasmid stabilization system protein ParE
MQIEILDEAEKDIENGIYFYEAQNQGLGRYFLDTILADIDSLLIYAAIHVKVRGYYRLLSKRFPFAIYYKVENNTVKIYAVLDCRQNPSWLEVRLK